MSKRFPPQGKTTNVVQLFPERADPSPFDRLTAALVVQQFRNGTLPEGVLLGFMVGVGMSPEVEHE